MTLFKIPYQFAPDCQSITRGSKSNFIASFRFLPRYRTDALIKVYAFFRIADDCVDELDEPQDKLAALNFWRGHLELMYQGRPNHPVMAELYTIITRFNIPQEYFFGLLDGCEMDVNKTRYQNFAELYQYCYRVAGLVGLTCMKIFEYESDSAKRMAVDLGMAFQLTNIIRDIRDDLKLNRIYLPVQDIQQFGYSEQELRAGVENAAFINLMDFYYHKASGYYDLALSEFEFDPEDKLVAAKVMTTFYHAILKKIRAKRFPVLRKKVSLNVFEKTYLLLPYLF